MSYNTPIVITVPSFYVKYLFLIFNYLRRLKKTQYLNN